MITLLVASRNAHKAREVAQILGPGFHCLTLSDFPGARAAVEDADTFAGNARAKALCLAEWLANNSKEVSSVDLPFYIVADDSGLEVDALNGAPGVHSARFAATDRRGTVNTPDADNNAMLLRLLQGRTAKERHGQFRCVLAVLRGPDFSPSQIQFFEGVCAGRITEAPSGLGGFGYDPLFVPDGFTQSFAELGDATKNQMSHRARALQGFKEFLGR